MISSIFHRVWLGEPVPEAFEANWRRLQELHPGFEFRSWEDPDELDWMTNRALFDSFTRFPAAYAFRADIARYEIVNRFGGCYIDTDVVPLRSMTELFGDDPFIGWCSDRELDPAVIASPPGHPAIRQLVDDLEQVKRWVDSGKPSSPPGVTGPRYVTERWRDRDDVRRLPPIAFFPYHWSRMREAAGPFPERSFAVHHWSAGWKFGTPRMAPEPARTEMPPVSFLVAFRDDDGSRTPAWDLIRSMLARDFPDAEIIVGTDDGDDPFHKTLALNRAAAQATGEVFCIWDADTWVDPTATRQAILSAAQTHGWARPWNKKLKLNREATEFVLSLPTWDGIIDHRRFGKPEQHNTFWPAPPLIVHREAFERVNGLDVRFRGWSGEDIAFGVALNKLVGAAKRFSSEAIHLWHPRIGASGVDLWPGQTDRRENDALVKRYRTARNAEAMWELVHEPDLMEVG